MWKHFGGVGYRSHWPQIAMYCCRLYYPHYWLYLVYLTKHQSSPGYISKSQPLVQLPEGQNLPNTTISNQQWDWNRNAAKCAWRQLRACPPQKATWGHYIIQNMCKRREPGLLLLQIDLKILIASFFRSTCSSGAYSDGISAKLPNPIHKGTDGHLFLSGNNTVLSRHIYGVPWLSMAKPLPVQISGLRQAATVDTQSNAQRDRQVVQQSLGSALL